ncbi:MAG: hypothetical protein J0H14_07050 [Alphaproteobacteria bacterium]|nr:hypothetical protein [Rhodospirillales bacterium]MBN9560474.1 hypothetical protein [Alphaproteobacteria bacterium]
MQGLVNFTTAIADGIAVLLPAFCYIAACCCFFFAVWTLRSLAYHHHYHHHRLRPWVPFVSLLLAGVFASFPQFLTMANVSAGTNLTASLTSYAPTNPGNASNVLGANPQASIINVVTLFQHFFQMFGAACVFWAVITWRSIVNGRANGSPVACGIQFAFGVMCINIVSIANGVVSFFQTGG